MIKFCAECEPLPQPRPRFSFGRCYQPKKIVEYKQLVASAAKAAMKDLEPMTGALKLSIKLYRKFKATSRRFGDFDNHAKAICDALNGVCFADDSQVVSCTVEKIQSEQQHIEVSIDSAGD